MYKFIKYIVNIVFSGVILVFLFQGVMGVSNLLFPIFKNMSILISFSLCFGIIYYYANLYEKEFRKKELLMKKDFHIYTELVNSIYNFDYSNLKVIQKIFYKDNKFCIVLNDVKVWIVKEALLSIKTQEDLIELDNILIKDILENKANLTLDTHGYQIYVNGALESLR